MFHTTSILVQFCDKFPSNYSSLTCLGIEQHILKNRYPIQSIVSLIIFYSNPFHFAKKWSPQIGKMFKTKRTFVCNKRRRWYYPQRKGGREKTKNSLVSSSDPRTLSVHYENAGTRACFRLRKCCMNGWDRYRGGILWNILFTNIRMSDTYARGDFRPYFSKEAERSGSGFIHTSIYRSQHRFIGVDPRATLGSARVQDPKKGHFGAVTEEDGRIS